MQAIVYHGPHQLEMEDVPEPELHTGEALIDVAASAICGSDVHGYGGLSDRRNANVPLIMGHEFTGHIAAIAGQADGALQVGDRVVIHPQISCGFCPACRAGVRNICPNMRIIGIERHGAFADRVTAPVDRVFKLPDGANETCMSCTETLSIQVHAFRHFANPLTRSIVVFGAGAQGLLAVQLAKLGGIPKIIVSDVVSHRLRLAAELGAHVTIDARNEDVVQTVRSHTDGWGVELAIDCAGTEITLQQGVAIVAPRGTLVLVGLGKGQAHIDYLPIVNREIVVRGSYCYTDDDFQRALELLANGDIDVSRMIQVAPLSEGAALLKRLANDPGELTKVVLKP